MLSGLRLRRASLALACLCLAPAPAWSAAPAPRIPTPHERLDRALTPVQRVLDELRVTPEERASLSDVLQRGEALAAEQVESTQRAEHARAAAAERSIAILARWTRARIEAVRAERAATEREQRASDAEASARQARGALERAAERRLVLDRDIERAQRAPSSTPAPTAAPTTASTGSEAVPRPPARPIPRPRTAPAGGAR